MSRYEETRDDYQLLGGRLVHVNDVPDAEECQPHPVRRPNPDPWAVPYHPEIHPLAWPANGGDERRDLR